MPSQLQTRARLRVATPWGRALLGALSGLVLALLLFAPASWLTQALATASENRLQLVEARGTLWNGSARLVLAGGLGSRDRAALPSRLQWELRPTWTGLTVEINAPCCTREPLQARLRLGWDSQHVQVANATSQWPAIMLAGLGTPWNTVQAQGSLVLTTQSLSLRWFKGRLALDGTAQLQALDISSRLSTTRPMGSYQLVLSGGTNPTLALSTLSGRLMLTGNGSWVGARFRFSGLASVEPDLTGGFMNLLNIIGRRQGAQSIITLG